MKHILFLLLLLPLLAYAQFPASPNKIRLGNQTTADGLVVRTASSPSWTPSTVNNAWLAFDTVAGVFYYYDAAVWNAFAPDNTTANNGLTLSGDTVQLGGTLTKNTEIDINGKTLRFRDAAGYPDLFINGTYGIISSDINTYLDVGSTSGRARIVASTTAQLTSAANTDVSATDTVTITGQRIRLSAADTRIQQVAKDNALNRVMMLDSLTGQVKYRDVSSIAGGGGGGGTVTGSGTTGTIPVWSSSTALGDSPLTVSGTDVTATGTGHFRLPNGTTAQQPAAPTAGMTRYNTSNGALEYYGASAWEVPVKSASTTGLGTATRLPRFDAAGRIASDVVSRIDPAIGLVSIGSAASVTTGTNNNFFGSNNGIANTTGVDNNFFGSSSGRANTTGSYNNFFGVYAGRWNTTGSGNNFFGLYTGQNNTTGGSNNFFGEEAGGNSTTGSFNDFFGVYSGLENTTGSYNTFIGNNSGRANTTGALNVAIGKGAMQTSPAAVTGSYNTTIGAEANKTITGAASGNLVVGDRVNLPTANGNNQVVIKNLIFGTGASGTGTTIAAGSKVGIKVAAPARDLEVAGEVRITDLTTDAPTRIVGADADGDLGQVTLGGNLTIAAGILSADNTNLTLADEGNGVRIQSSTGTDVDLLEDSGVYITRSGNAAYFGKYLAYGEASITSSQILTFAGGSTAYDTLSGYTEQAVDGFVLQGGALKYTGTRTIQVRVQVSISLTFAEAADVLAGIRQNTTNITKSRARQKIDVAGDINNISMTCLLTLAPNDLIRIELAPSAHTGSDDITVYNCNFNISEL